MPKKSHGHTNPPSPTYNVWINMKARCGNPKHPKFSRYGGRGIKVCERWDRSFEAFLQDVGPKSSGDLTLGRKDNDGNYTPKNCRWETVEQQANNKGNSRTFTKEGRTLTITEWSRELGLSVRALYYRLDKHGTIFI